jgi:hypothetical protein
MEGTKQSGVYLDKAEWFFTLKALGFVTALFVFLPS